MSDLADRRAKLRQYINSHCIARVPKGSKELPSLEGRGFYTWQFYLRRALLEADFLEFIGADFWDRFESIYQQRRFQLAGVESAALPVIITILMEAKRRNIEVSAFTIRKERKRYGKRNVIEGQPTSCPVLFVDDLSSPQHNAFWHAVNVIGSADLTMFEHGYVVIMKGRSDETRTITTSIGNVTLSSIFTLDDFELG
jgi:orotate phosphoribosyltransferase